MGNRDDLSGRRFDRWLVRHFSHKNGRGEIYWNCVCDCGTERDVKANGLRSGDSTSCGCYHKDAVTHHGYTGTPTFKSWETMKQRCLNPNARGYERYGGRGIKICKRWLAGFENFLEDMGERPAGRTLDRIDVNGDYKPGNCRWETPSRQQRNRSDRDILHWNGKSLCIADWSDITKIPAPIIVWRMKNGWQISDALSKHIMPGRGKKK